MSEVQRHIDYYNREQGPYVAQFMSWCDANNIKTNENDVLFPAENNPFELPFGLDYTNYSFERICISYRLFAPIPAIETIELPLPLPQGEKDAPDFSRCTIEEFFALMEKYPVATDYYLFQNKEFYQRFDAVYGKHVFDFFGSGGETIIEQETLHQKK